MPTEKPLPPLLSREAAHQWGKTQFFTGMPCIHGHIAPRYVSNGGCTACANKHKFRRNPWTHDKVVFDGGKIWRSRRLTPEQLAEYTQYLQQAGDYYESLALPPKCRACDGAGSARFEEQWRPCPHCPDMVLSDNDTPEDRLRKHAWRLTLKERALNSGVVAPSVPKPASLPALRTAADIPPSPPPSHSEFSDEG